MNIVRACCLVGLLALNKKHPFYKEFVSEEAHIQLKAELTA